MTSSYQGWDQGSSLIFWRWPGPMRKEARDGIPPYIKGHLPTNMKRSRVSPNDKSLIWAKLLKYLKKGYLFLDTEESITNVIDYFAVKKGVDDIRVVYNGASCGINAATWCSNFWLPTSTTLTRLLSYDYKVVDVDIGEMFPNFPIHDSLKNVVGIDLSPFPEELSKEFPNFKQQKRVTARWNRL